MESIRETPIRVLFVDDEQDLGETFCEILEMKGYQTTFMSSPEEALEFFLSHMDRFDATITDYNMPTMCGELSKKREGGSLPRLPK